MPSRRTRLWPSCFPPVLGLVPAALLGCGEPDRTPPTLLWSSPASGAHDVQVLEPIVLNFSEPMLPASTGAERFELTLEGRALELTTALSEDGLALSLAPRVVTWQGRSLRLRVLEAPTDLAGNPVQDVAEPLTFTLAQWQRLPDVASPEVDPSFAVQADAAGVPLVAHHQREGDQGFVVVKRWSGTAWERVGPPIRTFSTDAPVQLSLAVSPEGHPWLAWAAYKSGRRLQVHAQAWTGSAWRHLGPSPEQDGFPIFIPGSVSLRVSPQGTGYLTVLSGSSPVKRWSGAAWEDLPAPVAGGVNDIALEVAPEGPVVAVSSRLGGQDSYGISVWSWVDGGWRALGAPFNAGSPRLDAEKLLLALDGADRRVVAYITEHPLGRTTYLYAHAWNGTDWPLLGQPLVAARDGSQLPGWPSMLLDPSGAPWVAYSFQWEMSYELTQDVKRWDGAAWTYMPNPISSADLTRPAQLARAGDGAMFAAGRTPDALRAAIRLDAAE